MSSKDFYLVNIQADSITKLKVMEAKKLSLLCDWVDTFICYASNELETKDISRFYKDSKLAPVNVALPIEPYSIKALQLPEMAIRSANQLLNYSGLFPRDFFLHPLVKILMSKVNLHDLSEKEKSELCDGIRQNPCYYSTQRLDLSKNEDVIQELIRVSSLATKYEGRKRIHLCLL